MRNINTRRYWDHRFSSGDWCKKGGFDQTRGFAESIVAAVGIPRSFSGSICDFGCGAGDAMPVYRARFPRARLLGVDFSEAAIEFARSRHGGVADFQCGMASDVPRVDVIIASNVMEHLSNDVETAELLLEKCSMLTIVVPFREPLTAGGEHVNTYDDSAFSRLGPTAVRTFATRGWSEFGWKALWKDIYLKNLLRPLLRRPVIRRKLQIMYTFGSLR